MSVIRKFLSGKYQLNAMTVIVLSAVYMIIFDNNAFWSSLFSVIDLSSFGMYVFLFACFSVIFSVIFTFFTVFAAGVLLKPLIALVLVVASITAYYMDGYGTVFDDVMVLNIVETTFRESAGLIEPSILFHVFIFGVIPVLLLLRIDIRQQTPVKALSERAIAVFIVISVASLSVYVTYKDFTFIFRENREISFFINPVYPLRAVYRFSAEQIRKRNAHFDHIFKDAHSIKSYNKKNILILVVGETARPQNFHINHYPRDTTPELELHDVISFRNVSACGTATAISLPCMFSDLSKDNFSHNTAKSRENLLDALNIAGLHVLWRENNPDCKGICNRIEVQGFDDLYSDEFCDDQHCFDEVLLNGLDDYIEKLDNDAVIVLHTQGSHGPAYYRDYPENYKKFLPECRTADVQNCTDAEVINTYDNTILYTDHVISKVIDYLRQLPDSYSPAMIYVSDHGESLGENGVYLHGLPYFMAPEYQTKVPMILWLSDNITAAKLIDKSCIADKVEQALSHDNFLHSILGFMDVSAELYDDELDIFSSCRSK